MRKGRSKSTEFYLAASKLERPDLHIQERPDRGGSDRGRPDRGRPDRRLPGYFSASKRIS